MMSRTTTSEAALVAASSTESVADWLAGPGERWSAGNAAEVAIRQSGHGATMLSGSLDSWQCCTVAGWHIDNLAKWLDGSLAIERGGKLVICHRGDLAPFGLDR